MRDAGKEYFATRTGSAFAKALMERVEDFYRALETSGRMDIYARLHKAKYLGFYRGAQTNTGGDQDEFLLVHANHYANIIGNMVTMTSSSRPSYEPRATNSDHKSRAQTLVARGILDDYNRRKGMGKVSEDCTDLGVSFGEGEAVLEWDGKAGEDYMPDPNKAGEMLKEGDITFREFEPWNCIRDCQLNSAKKMTWRIYRDFADRFELASRFPEARDLILNMEPDLKMGANARYIHMANLTGSDQIPFYTFYHDRTAACPNGRMAIFVSDQVTLMEGALPYRGFPGHRLAPDEQRGTPFGYSIAFDLLPIQECVDALASIIQTNQEGFGVQNVLIPIGVGIQLRQLSDGMNGLYYDPKVGKPEPLKLLATPKEIFDWIEYLVHWMEIISGVNSVARGNPEASLKSGAALALVQSMAIQFNSKLQKAYASHIESMGTGVIQMLATFPQTKRMVEIAGKANRSYMKAFEAKDLQTISRVSVDMGNPLARTTAGKVQMAEDLMSKGLVNAEQYVQVLTTGNLEPMTEGKNAELMLIVSENELLADGKPPIVAITDDHALHIQEHKSVLASPESRMDPKIVKITTDHLAEHIRILEQLSMTNPNLLMALGQQPVQPPAPPSPVPAPPPGGGPAADLKDATNPVTGKAAEVKGPQMPKNPMNGQRVEPPLPTAAI